MNYPERFSHLPAYAFERLRQLLDCHPAGGEPLAMTIGEPKHPFPEWVGDVVTQNLSGFGKYPQNNGTEALLNAVQAWVMRRYGLDLPLDQFLALNGTREGLYNAAMALCSEVNGDGSAPYILTPNPFYQVYAVAAHGVGATPMYVPATADTQFLPDYNALSPDVLSRTAIAYICSPSNPQGAIASRDYLRDLLALAEKYDFRVFADECYAEIYRDAPPPGALEVAHEMGIDPERVLVFHSLSKRSNLPGLRSGFVAGGPKSIAAMRRLRAYSGAPLPEPLQAVAVQAWNDEAHVEANRAMYRQKFALADEIFADVPDYMSPQAGFFLWLPVEDSEAAAVKLWRETGVRVLPGAYLSRDVDGVNPGAGYIRVALVAPLDEIKQGLTRLHGCLYG